MSVAIDVTAILLIFVTVLFWMIQRRHERRDRAIEMYRHYETDTMKKDRKEAWRLLREWDGAANMSATDEDPERLLVHKDEFWSVLTFFLMLRRLVDAGHADRRIVFELFEDGRVVWAERISSTIGTGLSEPLMANALQAIQVSFGPRTFPAISQRLRRWRPQLSDIPPEGRRWIS